jgi:hypothetical protein
MLYRTHYSTLNMGCYVSQMNDGNSHSDSNNETPSPNISEHDALIRKLLSDPTKTEALSWLRADNQRTLGGCPSNSTSIKFIREIYALGAEEVLVVRVRKQKKSQGNFEHAGKLVARLPDSKTDRQRIFDWCRQQGESLGFSPDADGGERYLFLLVD